MAVKGCVGNVGPSVDRGQETIVAPTPDRHAADLRGLDHLSITLLNLGRQRRRVIDLSLLGREARV